MAGVGGAGGDPRSGVSVPVIGLAPGQLVAGLVVDGLVLAAASWLRARLSGWPPSTPG